MVLWCIRSTHTQIIHAESGWDACGQWLLMQFMTCIIVRTSSLYLKNICTDWWAILDEYRKEYSIILYLIMNSNINILMNCHRNVKYNQSIHRICQPHILHSTNIPSYLQHFSFLSEIISAKCKTQNLISSFIERTNQSMLMPHNCALEQIESVQMHINWNELRKKYHSFQAHCVR